MDAAERRTRALRRTARLCLWAMLATIVLSAFMRLTQAGLGCADWPACYVQAAREPAAASAGSGVAAARLAHRVVASVVLVGAVVILLTAWSPEPALRRRRADASALVVLALALAALGVVTAGARLPAVTIGNLLGGFAMLALCLRLATGTDAAPRLGPWAGVGLLLVAVQAALGAQAGAVHAALACTDLADCARAAAAGDWRLLDPLRASPAEALGPSHRAAAPVLLLHMLGGAVVAAAVGIIAVVAWRRGRRGGGAALAALGALQAALGPLVVLTGLPLPLVLAHNLVAALMLATLARLH